MANTPSYTNHCKDIYKQHVRPYDNYFRSEEDVFECSWFKSRNLKPRAQISSPKLHSMTDYEVHKSLFSFLFVFLGAQCEKQIARKNQNTSTQIIEDVYKENVGPYGISL